MEDALLGDDAADQEGDQDDDRHCAPAHLLQMMHGRRQAEGLGVYENVPACGQDRPQHHDEAAERAADPGHGAADLVQNARDRHGRDVSGRRLLHTAYFLDQGRVVRRQSGDLGLDAALSEAAA